MKNLIVLILVLVTGLSSSFAQNFPYPEGEKEAYLEHITKENIPFWVKEKLKSFPEIIVNDRMNPLYLRGDFDGDGLFDIALWVNNLDKKAGILICLREKENPILVGAGSSEVEIEDFWWTGVWYIDPGKKEDIILKKVEGHAARLSWSENKFVLFWD